MDEADPERQRLRDDLRQILTVQNAATVALPWLYFARTMVQIARRDTEECTYVNPLNKLVMNNYLGASMILRQTELGRRLLKRLELEPGAAQAIFDAMTRSMATSVQGAGKLLEANETLLGAIIDELQAQRTAGPGPAPVGTPAPGAGPTAARPAAESGKPG